MLSGQLQNLSRALQQLQSGYMAAARLEAQLRGELPSEGFDVAELMGAAAAVPAITHGPAATKPPVTKGARAPAAQHPPRTSTPAPATAAPPTTADREIKIFISSPFKDMQEERDLLVKRVIPRLKRLCSERDVVLTYVDLRWGVTGVQGEQAATMLMCLRELDKSNVFIGCYGARYGWCRSADADTALKQTDKDVLLARSMDLAEKEFQWVSDYRDRSVTEVEMRMILHNLSATPKKVFGFTLSCATALSLSLSLCPSLISTSVCLWWWCPVGLVLPARSVLCRARARRQEGHLRL